MLNPRRTAVRIVRGYRSCWTRCIQYFRAADPKIDAIVMRHIIRLSAGEKGITRELEQDAVHTRATSHSTAEGQPLSLIHI